MNCSTVVSSILILLPIPKSSLGTCKTTSYCALVGPSTNPSIPAFLSEVKASSVSPTSLANIFVNVCISTNATRFPTSLYPNELGDISTKLSKDNPVSLAN